MKRACAAVALAACACGGCRPEHPAPADASTSTNSAPPAIGSVGPSAQVHPPGGCRAIALDGDVRVDVAPVAIQAELAPDAWLSLDRGARLVAKDTRTTRETTFLGPARVRACADRREESWLAAGSFESAVGAGETPGAEEWIVTPLALVRYAAAKLRVDVRPKDTTVTLGSGVAFVWLAEGARVASRTGSPVAGNSGDDDWKRLNDGTMTVAATVASPASDVTAARAAVDGCYRLAERTRDLTTALLSSKPGTGTGNGTDAGADSSTLARQVETRRFARAACAVAALRVGALASSEDRSALSARLGEAVAAWSALPVSSRQ